MVMRPSWSTRLCHRLRTMCYSSQIEADYRAYVRLYGAKISLKDFYAIFWRKVSQPMLELQVPKAMALAFAQPSTPEEAEIKALIDQHRQQEATRLEALLFERRTRVVAAERALREKVTKTAEKEQRIARDKLDQARRWLEDLHRTEPIASDSRIFPDWYAPVMIEQDGERVVVPMRYHCLPAGRPAFFDKKYPGTFNARRDSLEGYWKGVFGVSHGVALWSAFYENVPLHQAEGRQLRPDEKPSSTRIQFKPRGMGMMLVACLWSKWSAPDQPDLYSFAAITDEPPAEVAAAGHDRCIIPLREENLDAWLRPDPDALARQYAILDDRQRPYYEHRLAA